MWHVSPQLYANEIKIMIKTLQPKTPSDLLLDDLYFFDFLVLDLMDLPTGLSKVTFFQPPIFVVT